MNGDVGWVTGGESDRDGGIAHLGEDDDGGTVEGGKEGSKNGGNEGKDGQYGGVDWANGQKQSPQADHRC